MGTGIVFVVLVAIWVAYFVQYWSRRREHLATARSVESFAEAMRVLERRPALRAPSGQRVSSAYAMSPARVVSARPAPRPQVIAKPHPTTPSPSRGGANRMSTPPSPRPAPQRTRTPRPRPAAAVTMSPSRRVRGLALLGSLLATLVTAVLAGFAILLWWAPLIALGAVGVSFLWLRSGVQSEIAARQAARAGPSTPQPARRRGARRHRDRRPGAAGARATGPRAGGARRAASRTSNPRAGEAASAAPTGPGRGVSAGGHAISEGPGADEPVGVEPSSATDTGAHPDGWQPVPVPPPTYTLKARAERPPAPEATTDAAPDSEADPAPQTPGTTAAFEAPVAPGAPVEAGDTPAAGDGEAERERTAAYGT